MATITNIFIAQLQLKLNSAWAVAKIATKTEYFHTLSTLWFKSCNLPMCGACLRVCLEVFWEVSVRCTKGVLRVPGMYMEGVWKVFWRSLEGYFRVYERCLKSVLKDFGWFQEHAWNIPLNHQHHHNVTDHDQGCRNTSTRLCIINLPTSFLGRNWGKLPTKPMKYVQKILELTLFFRILLQPIQILILHHISTS